MNLKKFLDQKQGCSYNFNTGEINPPEGYMVSMKGYELKVPENELDMDILVQYINTNIRELTRDEIFLGVWYNDGYAYLDLSVNVRTYPEALNLKVAWDQQAIFDCKNKVSI